jgi:hypothetical protein
MAAGASTEAFERLRWQIEETAPDQLKIMLTTMVSALLRAEVEAVCGVGQGEGVMADPRPLPLDATTGHPGA